MLTRLTLVLLQELFLPRLQGNSRKKDINLNLVHVEEEPKSAKKKVSTKKTTRKQSARIVLRDTPVETLSKKKEKMDVTRGKGIELLSKVALTEDAQFKEVQKKSLRDFHRTHPSGSGAAKIKPSVTSKGTGAKLGVPDVMEGESSESSDQENDSDDDNTQSKNEKGSDSGQETEVNESGSKSNQHEYEEEVKDDDEEEDAFVKTPSNYTPTDDEDETNVES
ncbi:hypothetical protein Tco_1535644, partial [Tanacetum coccineum]